MVDVALGLRERLSVSLSRTPTFFGIVCQTLDRTYARIKGERDERIKARLDELRRQWNGVLVNGGPDYADPVTRFAYLYMYVSAHADYLDRMIRQSGDLQEVLGRDEVSIACLGGGPGSDVLGFLKFFLERGDSPHITYSILDKENAWADTWSDLDRTMAGSLRPSRIFRPFDITKPTTYASFDGVHDSDIFTMIYFLSEVFAHREAVTRFLDTCFARMKPGAQLIVIDFKSPAVQDWIDQRAEAGGLEGGGGEEKIFMDSSEQKSELKFYTDKFDITPKIKASMFYRLYRKPVTHG